MIFKYIQNGIELSILGKPNFKKLAQNDWVSFMGWIILSIWK